ncbi:MAG TPA: VOC family protein [Thermoanaerobaculia bacterium]|jgi:catechol 2,3-dioxygenase-like lactoylglutathione lyase family enzyme|nr:VOC family protein [Thermoanaerobaculia bacterium]
MIQRLSHAPIFVLDQEIAYDFYVNKLGLEVRTDATMDNGFRWLTVGPKGQKDLEIILMLVGSNPKSDPEASELLRTLIGKGALGAGVFETADCRQTYEELRAKGVEFVSPPTDQFYAVEAIFKDPFGNWFSLSQPK